MKQTLQEMATTATGLRLQVIEDALDQDQEYQKGYLEDVTSHGCVSGACSGLIYYSDTVAFYDKHENDIEDMLEEDRQSFGYKNRAEMIASLNGADNVGSITQEKNLLAWYAYERAAFDILDNLDNNN